MALALLFASGCGGRRPETLPLSIRGIADPPPNASGWNSTAVTVYFQCTGGATQLIRCTDPQTIATEGANQKVSGSTTDAGGETASTSVVLNIDKFGPTISPQISPPLNGSGWTNTVPVTVSFVCADPLSGIANCPQAQTIATAGSGKIVQGTATDKAGNTTTTSVTVNIGTIAPSISASVSPAPNSDGWNNSAVTVAFKCEVGSAPVISCPSPQVVTTQGQNQSIAGTAQDAAGNVAQASATINLDTTPPKLAVTSPVDGTTIATATSSIGVIGTASDDVSGLDSVTCNGASATISNGTFACTVNLVTGKNPLTIVATDHAGNKATATEGITYGPTSQITVTILSPSNLSITNLTPVTVNGTVSDPTATLTVNGIAVAQSAGSFSTPVPLVEGLNVLSVVATNPAGLSSTATVQVTLDTTPPHITIDSPTSGTTTTADSVTVLGLANDVVVGTVNSRDVQVTVNGLPAQVANRSYSVANVPLALGPNTIQAVGRDQAGNSTTTSVIVTRALASQPPPPAIGTAIQTEWLNTISGDGQSGVVGTVLGAPLVVSLIDQNSQPVQNQAVIFKVTGGNGLVAGNGSAAATSAAVMTDSSGSAQVAWTLGTRAGAGANKIEVSSAMAVSPLTLSATGLTGTPAQIVVDSGNNQTGIVGQPLPFPFVADVVDSGHNRVPDVPVTFTVTQGGGTFAGQASTTINSDSNGRVIAVLTTGTQEGINNNVVQATFDANTGFPAAFSATAKKPGNPADTTISGVVLDNSSNPIPGVTIRLYQTNQGNANNLPVQVGAPAVTGAQGTFLIPSAPVGSYKLMADGGTVTGIRAYPPLEYDVVTVAGTDNTVGMPIYLPALDTVNKLCIDETHGGVLTLPQYPGFSLTVAAGSATFPGGARSGCVSVTPVNGDKVPMAPGFGQQPRFIVTIQPVGTMFNPPAAITLPNVDGLKPNEVTEMYSYDHDLGMFTSIGTGTVSSDGSKIVSNPGVGVLKAGWHCGGNPNATGSAGTCPQCRKCNGTDCEPDPAQQCKSCSLAAHGQCDGSGNCTSGPAPFGTIGITPNQLCSGAPTVGITKELTYSADNLDDINIPSCPAKKPNVRWTISDGSPTESTSLNVSWTAPNNPSSVAVELDGQDLSGNFVKLESGSVSVVIPTTDTSSRASTQSCPSGFGKDDLYTAVVKYDSCYVDFSGIVVQERDDGANPMLILNDCDFDLTGIIITGGPVLTIDSSNKYAYDELELCAKDVTIPAVGCHIAFQTQWQVGPNRLNYVVHTNYFSIPPGNSKSNPPGGFSQMTTSRTP